MKLDVGTGGGGMHVAVNANNTQLMGAITRNGHSHLSTNGGDTWTPSAVASSLSQINHLMFHNNTLHASGSGGVYRANSAAVDSWIQFGLIGSTVLHTQKEKNLLNTFYAVTSDGKLHKTIDNGANFPLVTGLPDGVTVFDFNASANPRVLWVGAGRSLYRNNQDDGPFVERVVDPNPNHSTNIIRVLAVAPTDPDVVAVAFNQNARLTITHNGGL